MSLKLGTVKPVILVTSIKQATCIKQAHFQFHKKSNYIKLHLY